MGKRINEIIKLKFEVVDAFPDVWGQPFGYWYRVFVGLDGALDLAKDRSDSWIWSEADVIEVLELAKRAKNMAEQGLEGVLID